MKCPYCKKEIGIGEMADGLVRVGRASRILGVMWQTLNRWDKEEVLKGVEIDGVKHYERKELEDLLEWAGGRRVEKAVVLEWREGRE